MRFDLLRVDVFARTQHDDFFAAAGDVKLTLRVEKTQVAGVQPAIHQGGGGGVGAIEVALHHDGAAEEHFAVPDPFCEGFIPRKNLHLDPGQRRPDRIRVLAAGANDRSGAGSFGQAIGLYQIEAQPMKRLADGRVKAGTAGDQKSHLAAEDVMHAAKQPRTEVDAHGVAKEAIHPKQRAKGQAFGQARRGDLLGDALVEEVEELRHAAEQRDVALGERSQQLGRVQRLQEDNSGSAREWQQQIGHLREGVEQREHAEDRVALVHAHDPEDSLHFGEQVAVCQHDALGVAGGAGGVEDHGGICTGRWARRHGHNSLGRTPGGDHCGLR